VECGTLWHIIPTAGSTLPAEWLDRPGERGRAKARPPGAWAGGLWAPVALANWAMDNLGRPEYAGKK